MAAGAQGFGDGHAGGLQARDFGGQILAAQGPGAGAGAGLEEGGPDMLVHQMGIGVGLGRDEFQVSAVGESDQRHPGDAIVVAAAVDAGQTHGGQGALHLPNIAPGHGDVVEVEVRGGKKHGWHHSNQKRPHGTRSIRTVRSPTFARSRLSFWWRWNTGRASSRRPCRA
jgi:hypothetical protein